IDVGYFEPAAGVDEMPVEPCRMTSGANHVAGDNGIGAVGADAGHPELRATIFLKPISISGGGVFFEQTEKFLLLLGRIGLPVAADGEAADAGHIEIALKQLAETSDALGRRNIGPQRLNAVVAKIANKSAGIGSSIATRDGEKDAYSKRRGNRNEL